MLAPSIVETSKGNIFVSHISIGLLEGLRKDTGIDLIENSYGLGLKALKLLVSTTKDGKTKLEDQEFDKFNKDDLQKLALGVIAASHETQPVEENAVEALGKLIQTQAKSIQGITSKTIGSMNSAFFGTGATSQLKKLWLR